MITQAVLHIAASHDVDAINSFQRLDELETKEICLSCKPSLSKNIFVHTYFADHFWKLSVNYFEEVTHVQNEKGRTPDKYLQSLI